MPKQDTQRVYVVTHDTVENRGDTDWETSISLHMNLDEAQAEFTVLGVVAKKSRVIRKVQFHEYNVPKARS